METEKKKEEKYFTGLVGETEDMACHIYVNGFPRLTVYAFLDEHGNQVESDDEVQKEAERIAQVLNTQTETIIK